MDTSVSPSAYHDELTPDICITVVDGNAHKCAFSLVDFLKIWLKFTIHFKGNPATVTFDF